MKAIWNNQIIAESSETIQVEGNHYFPPQSVNKQFLKNSSTHTTCPWKGEAAYNSLEVGGMKNKDAAWFYNNPKYAAQKLKNYVAFWKGVEIIP